MSASKTRKAIFEDNDVLMRESRTQFDCRSLKIYFLIMLDIIDRYVAKIFLGFFVGSLTVLVSLFVVIDAFSNFSDEKVTLGTVALFYAFSIPGVISQMFPAACLIATMFTLSTLNKNNELTALFSSGISLARVSAPILILVASMTILVFWSGDRLLPTFNKKKNYIWFVEVKNRPQMYSSVKNSKIWYRQSNVLFNIRYLNPDEKRANGVSFYYFDDDWNMVQNIKAQYADLKDNEWILKDGSVTLFTEDSSFPMNQTFSEKVVKVDNSLTEIQAESKKFSEMVSVGELREFIKKNKDAGLNTLRYEVDFHAKFGFAFASFVMSFIGIPFSVVSNRSSGRMGSTVICLFLAFGYWSLFSSGLTLGRYGYLPPIISAWLPNMLTLGLTTFFLLRLKR